ncbi:hypothetical protein SAMN00768000_3795 [Sulfobacillus thermosulfidooxidans DSM 9293]|uniref:Tryptophan synthase beta chain-like PALP domain-containing protein n=1 Tax=Sulfobacillus thermosulfidooxidans (strain DSM 9293 / VKM B-1269 / AT-1) TaxID=929705 RepID=A0A1W1WPK3_SULTA|nr:hypothetical protein SAMN00768000_3795 [Sulfobacillus thermosulfidooxidans DSM 9293]
MDRAAFHSSRHRPFNVLQNPWYGLLETTPIRRIQIRVHNAWTDLFLKLESENFAGSIKARTALCLINSLEPCGESYVVGIASHG